MLPEMTSLVNKKPAQPARLSPETREIVELTEHLLADWQETHGPPIGKISAMMGIDCFAVLIEDTFTRAEMALAAQPEGQNLLQRYIEHLMQQVCPQLSTHVETVMARPVTTATVSPNLKGGWIICLFKLGESASGHENQVC